MSYKVLIVDDSGVIRQAVRKPLTAAGYEIVGEASNGLQAIELFKRHKPDLVTLDIVMPEMDGLTALNEILNIRNDASVLMISSLTDLETANKAIEKGAMEFLQKPFTKDELLGVVAMLFDPANQEAHRERMAELERDPSQGAKLRKSNSQILSEDTRAFLRASRQAAKTYLEKIGDFPVRIGKSHLLGKNNLVSMDYTSFVAFMGELNGCFYVTSTNFMLEEIMRTITGDADHQASPGEKMDLIGEILNIIAGNVREELGNRYEITLPLRFEGKPTRLDFGMRSQSYLIPLQWNRYTSFLIAGAD